MGLQELQPKGGCAQGECGAANTTAASELVSADGSSAHKSAQLHELPSKLTPREGWEGQRAQEHRARPPRAPISTSAGIPRLLSSSPTFDRGQSAWPGISCFYSLGHRLISCKGKRSQTIAPKLCEGRRALRCAPKPRSCCSRGREGPAAEAQPSTAHDRRGRENPGKGNVQTPLGEGSSKLEEQRSLRKAAQEKVNCQTA